MRHLEWVHAPQEGESAYEVDYVLVMREGEGEPWGGAGAASGWGVCTIGVDGGVGGGGLCGEGVGERGPVLFGGGERMRRGLSSQKQQARRTPTLPRGSVCSFSQVVRCVELASRGRKLNLTIRSGG